VPGQPLSKFSKGKGLNFGPPSSWKRPLLLKYVMLVIEHWSTTELRLLLILRHCLGGDPTIAAEMLLAIENQNIQRTVIMTATKAVLPKDDWPLVEAAFMSMNASRNVRNRFAHHIWGVADDMPDALLLLDPKDMAILMAQLVKQAAINKMAGKEPAPVDIDDILDRSKVMVWREKDFQLECDIAHRASTITDVISKFIFMTKNGQSADSIRQSLLSDPLIQERLRKQSPQKSPEARPIDSPKTDRK
jgi:hypothetical protein